MSSCRDMALLNWSTHCKGFWAFNINDEILVKSCNSGFYLVTQTEICIWIVCLSLKQFTCVFLSYHHHHAIPLLCTKEHNSHHAWCWPIHIMDSHGLYDWYSQPTLRVLHNSYSSRRWLTLRFFLISYVGRRSARPVIRGAWNVPSGCLWYDGWSCKLLVENLRSMESCMICRTPTIYQTYL